MMAERAETPARPDRGAAVLVRAKPAAAGQALKPLAWGVIRPVAGEMAALQAEGPGQVEAPAAVAALRGAVAQEAVAQRVQRRRRASIQPARRTDWIAHLGNLLFQSVALGSSV